MPSLTTLPLLWGQTTPDENELPLLAFRRWVWGQTLSSPRADLGLEPLGAWVLGLLALLLLAMVVQGPARAMRQLFDLAGHARLLVSAIKRLRASARLVMILLGVAVLSWTTSLFFRYNRPSGLVDLSLLLGTKSVGEVAVEQGLLAALTPLRDLFSLADLLPLVAVGVILVFRFSTELWTLSPSEEATQPTPAWVTFSWVSAALYGLYRMAVLVASGDDLPMGASLLIEPLIVPILMLVTDALLVSWVLVELRRAVRSSGVALVEVSSCLTLLPVALLACLFAMPSRYVAPTAYLMLPYVSDGVAGVVLAPLLGGWGLTYLQASALLAVGLVGVVPWCRGGVGSALVGYGRLLRTDGGHLVAALSLGGMAAGIASAIAYLLVLTLPPQPWVLSAADSYAHYGTLVTGLALLSALVELGARSSSGSGSEEQARQSEASLLVR